METDMDLGTYERMLDQDLTGANSATSGQIYRTVLDKERGGGLSGCRAARRQACPFGTGRSLVSLGRVWLGTRVVAVATVVCGGRTNPQEPMTKDRRMALAVLGVIYLLGVAAVVVCG
jgi:hypothetical protein